MNYIVDKLVEQGLLSETDAQDAFQSLEKGDNPVRVISHRGNVSEESLLKHIAEVLGYPFFETLEKFQPQNGFLSAFPAKILLERQVVPVEYEISGKKNHLLLISNPFDTIARDELRLLMGTDFEIGLASSREIARFIKKYLGVGADIIQSMVDHAHENGLQFLAENEEQDSDLSDPAAGASIIHFVNQILTEAIERRATDVHIEPYENELRIRYRIDGILQVAEIPPEVKRFQAAIVSRIKILSNLDIAEKRIPQDGRIKVLLSGREVDIRVSIIPMLHGEAVVLRLLDCSSILLGLEKIGMGSHDLDIFDEVIKRPHGIILVTGPTGSGKTTTLYAALSKINETETKIITIEDPIEYQLYGVNQIQVSAKTGLTFAKGLRSILRHDPDVILIGEIRDLETAEIAVQASLTGHLVFSTLHTNDAPGAMTRLIDMGVEAYLVASSLESVLAQRLIRLICPHCKNEIPDKELNILKTRYGDMIPDKLYRGSGCELCQGTGYIGRTGIYEQMVVTDELRALLLQNATPQAMRKVAEKQGMRSLRRDGIRYLINGLTTVEEVLRVTKSEIHT